MRSSAKKPQAPWSRRYKSVSMLAREWSNLGPPRHPSSTKSRRPLARPFRAANMVSVTSFSTGSTRVRREAGGRFWAESKSPTTRSGTRPSFRAVS